MVKMETELSHAYELACQLEAQLSSAPAELQSLVRALVACLQKAKSMVQSAEGATDSPRSFAAGDSEQPFRAKKRGMISKRRTRAMWTNHVKLGTGPEAEGPLDDGYSWRKYGQKDIHGAKNPRGYFRCTHRKTQGCLAMKQVQISDTNALIYEVAYLGAHTCLQKSSSFPDHGRRNDQQLPPLGFQTNLKVETGNLDVKFQDPTSSFSFPNTPIDSCFENSFDAAFISPTISEPNYFSSYEGPGFEALESDFAEMMPGISPKLDGDDPTTIEFDADFQFDPTNFIL